MTSIKKAVKLSNLIQKFGADTISKDEADLLAFRYYANKKRGWTHTSLSQLANNIVLMQKIKKS